MKKSECYSAAMKAVLRADFQEDEKIEILNVLMANKNTAEWCESQQTVEVQE